MKFLERKNKNSENNTFIYQKVVVVLQKQVMREKKFEREFLNGDTVREDKEN